MKKRSIYFMLSGAVALAGIFGISSCSSSDDVTSEVNPTYNPETGEVNVDFVFNVSTMQKNDYSVHNMFTFCFSSLIHLKY